MLRQAQHDMMNVILFSVILNETKWSEESHDEAV